MEVELRTVLEWWTATWTWRRWQGRGSGWWPDMASSDRPDDDVAGLCDTNNGKVIFSSDMPLCIFIPRTITLMTTFVLCWTVRPLTHSTSSPHIHTSTHTYRRTLYGIFSASRERVVPFVRWPRCPQHPFPFRRNPAIIVPVEFIRCLW